MSRIDSIIDSAKGYIGISEGSPEHRKIIDLYNKARYSDAYEMTINDPWCAAFVVAMFQANDMASIIPGYAACDQMIEIFKQWGRWHNHIGYSPKKGDIVFYNWNGDKVSDHVGIITQNKFGTLTVIEGNISDSVGYRSVAIENSTICGYGTPNYNGEIEVPKGKTKWSNATYYDKSDIKSLPVLSNGSTGVFVKILQLLLRHKKNSDLVVDGSFGLVTENALKDFQTSEGIEVDGICGRETWAQLLL